MSGQGQPSQTGVAAVAAQPTPPRVQFQEDFFVYGINFVGTGALPSLGTLVGAFQVQADSDFKLIKMAYAADIGGAAQDASTRVIPLVAMQILDNGSGRNLFSQPTPIPSIMGEGDLPFIMPIPRIFKARASVQITVTSYDAAATYNLRLSFIGTKIFQLGPGQ